MATKTIKAIVAPRRTVWVDNKPVGPGGEVNLPSDEVAHLREQGFLVNPTGPATPVTGAGPSFGPVAGEMPAGAGGDAE